MQIAGAEDEEDSEKTRKKKRKKRGGRNSSPGDQSGAETPQSLAELSFFSRWLFRVTCFYVGSYGKLSSWDLVFFVVVVYLSVFVRVFIGDCCVCPFWVSQQGGVVR